MTETADKLLLMLLVLPSALSAWAMMLCLSWMDVPVTRLVGFTRQIRRLRVLFKMLLAGATSVEIEQGVNNA